MGFTTAGTPASEASPPRWRRICGWDSRRYIIWLLL